MGRKEKFAFYLSGEEGHLRAAVPGGLKPQSHRLHRTSRRLLSGLLQRQQRRTLSPGLHQILCGRPTGTVWRIGCPLLYKQAVEQDMVAGILADAYQFNEEGSPATPHGEYQQGT